MHRLYVSTVNEIIVTLLKKKTIFLLILSALLPVLAAVAAGLVYRQTGVMLFGSADFPVWVLGIFTKVLLPLYIFMWAADSLAGAVEDLSIKMALLRPVTRFKVYLSKNLAIISLVLLNLLIVLASSLAASGMVPSAAWGLAGLGRDLAAYLLAVFPLMGLILIAAFLAQVARSGSAALLLGILFYLAGLALPLLSPLLGSLLPTAYTGWHLLWLAPMINWRSVGLACAVLFANYLVFFPAGYYFFERRDI